jgi:hypothetical protein
MKDIAVQAIGLAALLAAVAGGYWRWIRPYNITTESKGLLLLIVLTMVGGLLGSTGWWFDVRQAFAWDLPPLASRMLAAAGWAFGAVTFMALQRPTRQRIQLVLLMLAAYLIPLVLAIEIFHFRHFDWTAPISYAFFILVTLLIVPTVWYLFRRPMIIADSESKSPARAIYWWFIIVAVLTGLWGAALFITDNGPISLIWVWPGDLLTSRLIAVMLFTIAAAALYSLRHADAARVTLAMLTVYGLGAALANLWGLTAGKPVQPLYLVTFGAIGLVSLWLWRGTQPE